MLAPLSEPDHLTPPGTDAAEAERKQVLSFLADTRAPAWLTKLFNQWKKDRDYLRDEVFAEDDDSVLTVNVLLRSIYSKLNQVWPENPDPVMKPASEVEPPENHPMRPEWEALRKFLEQVGKSGEVLCRKWAKDASMAPVLRLAALKTFTTGLCWLKSGWVEDPSRGPLGQSLRHVGSRDQVIKMRQLTREFQAGVFQENSEKFQTLMDLTEWLRREAEGKLRTLPLGDPREARIAAILASEPGEPLPLPLIPEPEIWMCPVVDLIDGEDLRWDWARVTAPSLCHLGRHWTHRVWMSRDEAAERFHLDEEEKARLGSYRASFAKDQEVFRAKYVMGTTVQTDPMEADVEAQTRCDDTEVAVWERWDLETGMIYKFCAGIDRHLEKEPIDCPTIQGHPFRPLFFNEVDGQFGPVSDVKFGRKTQDNMNQALTDDWEARIAAYPFYAIAHGILTEEDIKAIETGRRAHKVVELSRSSVEVAQAIQSIKGEEYHPERYQIAISQMSQLMERMLGAPAEAQSGQGKPEFASQLVLMQQSMNAASGRVAKIILESMQGCFEDWMAYALMRLPEKNVQRLAGMAAVWPAVGREEVMGRLIVEVVSAGPRMARRADLEDLGQAMGVVKAALDNALMAQQVGFEFQVMEVVNRAAAALDLRTPGGLLKRLAPMLPPVVGLPGPGGGGGAGPTAEARPGIPPPAMQAPFPVAMRQAISGR